MVSLHDSTMHSANWMKFCSSRRTRARQDVKAKPHLGTADATLGCRQDLAAIGDNVDPLERSSVCRDEMCTDPGYCDCSVEEEDLISLNCESLPACSVG